MILYLILIITFIIGAGFFAGSETGLVASNKIKIKILEEKGYKTAKVLSRIVKNSDEYLACTLIGTNICVVSASILTTSIFSNYFDFTTAAIISTGILTPTMLIFSEVIPKSAFLANATNFSLKTSVFIRFFIILFKPIILFLRGLSYITMKILGVDNKHRNFYVNKDTIQQVFQWGTTEGVLEAEERDFVYSILATHKITAREVMVPLVNVVSIELTQPLSELVEIMEKSNYSRIPVYEKRVDNIVGYVSCRDLIYSDKNDTIKELMRDCEYIPETKPTDFLMIEMQKKRVPIVFVVDEYGGCSGIITNEDIAEIIVGEILDEGEIYEGIKVNENGSLLVSGQFDVDDLNHQYNLEIVKKGFETIAGFVSYILGHIPEIGEKFEYEGYKYTIVHADEKSVDKVLIEKSG